MISDEKRREVSRLLREEFGRGQCQWPDLFRDMLAEILECNETLDGAPLYDQMAEKLADLIDRPLVHVNVNKRGRACCSNCGCDDWCFADGSRFCPNCGTEMLYD